MSVIHESAENYLESILMLSKKLPVVRSIDVANELGFKKSSVSIAMKNLRESNHITVTKEGYIYLTESGKEIAEMIYERHQLLTSWLIRLGVDPKVAEEDACRIEHDISKDHSTLLRKLYLNFSHIISFSERAIPDYPAWLFLFYIFFLSSKFLCPVMTVPSCSTA